MRHEQRIRGVDGRYRWFLTQAGPVLDDAGRVVQWFGAATDVHEHRLALDALRASREQLRDAVDEFEAGVEERTAELREALTSLSREQDVRKELLRRLVNVQEDERRRISRELHDQMGQHVASLMLGLRLAKDAAEDGSPLRDRLERLEVAADRIGREAHRIALELRPTALDDLGLVPALVNHLDDWALRTGVAAEVRTAGFDGERLPPPVETTIYRVVLEALTNVFKHADARRVIVTLNRFKDVASLIIEDDGKGFDVPRSAGAKGKLGVVGMRERAALVGGTLEVESTPDGGTSILVRIPVPTAADAP